MKRVLVTAALIGACSVSAAHAQCYGSYYAPPRGLIGAILAPIEAQQRAEACARARADAAYRAQMRAIEEAGQERQAQAEAQARQQNWVNEQAETRRREEAEEARARKIAAQKAKAAAAAQEAAENSPDNSCRNPQVARMLLEQFNKFDTFERLGIEAVDIKHLTTVASSDVVCHGVFVLSNGGSLKGTISFKKNVAGDMISEWKRD